SRQALVKRSRLDFAVGGVKRTGPLLQGFNARATFRRSRDRNRMIFGFNTDVKHDDTVYHVQSEAREAELLLQTQVFVRGRCVGKRATSYADKLASGCLSDQQKEQVLR